MAARKGGEGEKGLEGVCWPAPHILPLPLYCPPPFSLQLLPFTWRVMMSLLSQGCLQASWDSVTVSREPAPPPPSTHIHTPPTHPSTHSAVQGLLRDGGQSREAAGAYCCTRLCVQAFFFFFFVIFLCLREPVITLCMEGE